MQGPWRPKPGDRVVHIHPRRIKGYQPRQILGIPALVSAGYGDVGSSIYYALGIVAIIALGATPIALGVAGIIYVFNALTYAEGTAMLPEAGGSAGFARYGFNDLGGFIGGWALMLSYVAAVAVSASAIPPYLSYFWPALMRPAIGTAVSMAVILFLTMGTILGRRESTRLNIALFTIDILTQVSLVVAGLVLILWRDPAVLPQHMFGPGDFPSREGLILGIAVAALAFTGLETVSQLAQETKRPAQQVPRAYMIMIFAVLVLFAGISVVALSAMTPQILADPVTGWAKNPVSGIAASLPLPVLRDIFQPLVAVLAAVILLSATNAGLLGIARLAFNLSLHQELPPVVGRIHRRLGTPHVAIVTFCALALLLMVPGFWRVTHFVNLGALYAFGSLLSFGTAHAAVLSLRVRHPELPRPFKLRGNLRIGGRELPVTVLLGLVLTAAVWLVLAAGQPFTLAVGLAWMITGVAFYYVYRKARGLPLTRASYPGRTGPAQERPPRPL